MMPCSQTSGRNRLFRSFTEKTLVCTEATMVRCNSCERLVGRDEHYVCQYNKGWTQVQKIVLAVDITVLGVDTSVFIVEIVVFSFVAMALNVCIIVLGEKRGAVSHIGPVEAG